LRDLLVIVPSRGRPGRLTVMLDAALSLSEAETDISVATDDDDPSRGGYEALSGRFAWHHGPRDTFTGWLNRVALASLGGYRALASLGDDHVPRTQGWDRLLLAAIDQTGGTGIAYGSDLHQGSALATSVVMSSDIAEALGWMSLPGCAHYHTDDACIALGREAGCLAYVPDVVIELMHPAWGTGFPAGREAPGAGPVESRAFARMARGSHAGGNAG
jgi:hypothetical protein